MSAIRFIKLYMYLMFVVGALGVIKLKKQLKWSNLQFRTYTALFLFSPIIMQKIAVGHSPFINLFIFPWLIYFLVDRKIFKSILGISATMALTLLQGGVYAFIWFMIFFMIYSLLCLFIDKNWISILKMFAVPIFVIILAFIRIFLAYNDYSDFSRGWFMTYGYTPVTFLTFALIPTLMFKPFDVYFYQKTIGLPHQLPPHESGIFWGYAIIMLITLIFGYKKIIFRSKKPKHNLNIRALLLTSLFLLLFSFYSFWTIFLNLFITYLKIPFFESIKNYGFRLAIPAYFGFSIVLANNAEQIWQKLIKWQKTILWKKIRSLSIIIFNVALYCFIIIWIILTIFKSMILKQFNDIIELAYNGNGYNYIREKMQGIEQYSIDFYYFKTEYLYTTIQHWVVFISILFFLIKLLTYLIKNMKSHSGAFRNTYPYFKFEMLVAIPLLFSLSMWTKLGISIPYAEFPIQKVESPEVVTIGPHLNSEPNIYVTPKKMVITPKSNNISSEYKFPEIIARDVKYLEVETNNATLLNVDNEMIVKPIDNNKIVIVVKTQTINNALYITLFAWTLVILIGIINLLRKKILHIF